jgi:hypothetical protein
MILKTNITNITNITFINLDYIKKNTYEAIKNIIFKYNGVIFGEFVRDYIISEYYTDLFKKDVMLSNCDIWNSCIDRDTIARTIVPDDIDIYINDVNISYKMMLEIDNYLNNHFGSINIKKKNFIVINKLNNNDEIIYRYGNDIDNIYRYNYEILISRIPYVSEGVTMNIVIDIVIADKIAPFGKLDFLCNGFIMTNNNSIHLSTNTGTDLDNLEFVEKKEIEAKIIKDIVNFRTYYCNKFPEISNKNNYYAIEYNEIACKKIENMINNKWKWNILNLPFIIIHHNKYKNIYDKCSICFEKIKKKNKKIIFNENNLTYMFHNDCFFKYMYKQLDNKKLLYIDNNLEEFLLRCPNENIINLDIKNIYNIIENYLNRF